MNYNIRKEIFSIPNLLGYFRILMIPVFLYLYYNAETTTDYRIAFLVLAISMSTDLIDGWVARKFNMITDIGKALDPIADKLTQGSLAIAVSFRYPLMVPCLMLFIVKEFYMGIMGLYLKKKYNFWYGAKWYGKLCTVIIDVCVFALLLFRGIADATATIMIWVMMVCMVISLVMYVAFHISVIKRAKQDASLAA